MTRFHSRVTLGISSLLLVSALLAGPLQASTQRRRPIPPPPGKPVEPTKPNVRTADQANLEMQILMSRRTLDMGSERERARQAAQLTRDFERLQQLNLKKIMPQWSLQSTDYTDLAQASGEINDRAKRIKFNMTIDLRGPGEKIRYEADEAQLSTMLPTLSRAITSFLASPVFRISSPDDAALRRTAARDLESIIKLSEAINKVSKRLSKTVAVAGKNK